MSQPAKDPHRTSGALPGALIIVAAVAGGTTLQALGRLSEDMELLLVLVGLFGVAVVAASLKGD